MGKTCKMVFLDINGKPSQVYLNALKKHGPEKAKELYVKHMLNNKAVKFSKKGVKPFSSLESLERENDTLELTDDNVYIDSNGNVYSRTTNVLHDIMMSEQAKNEEAGFLTKYTKSNSEKTYDLTTYAAFTEGMSEVEALKFITVAENVAKRRMGEYFKPINQLRTEEEIRAYVKTVIEADEKAKEEDPTYITLHEKFTKDVFKSWYASTEYGTIFHNTMEEAINYRNELIEGGEDSMVYNDSRVILYDMPTENKEFIRGKRRSIGQVFDKVLSEADEFSRKLGGKKVKIITERKLKTMKLKDGNGRGIAGTADLLFVSEDNDVMIYDYKTKSEESARNFEYSSSEHLGGPWKDYMNNARNKAQAQISIYGAILEEKGFNVVGGKVIMVPGNFRPKVEHGMNYIEEVGDIDWELASLNADEMEIKPVTVMKGAVKHYFEHGEQLPEDTLPIHHTLEKMSGGKMLLHRENLDTFIQNNWHKQYNERNKKWFIQAKGKDRLYMDQWSDAKAKKYLTNVYNELKAKQKQLPMNVINYFNTRGVQNVFSGKMSSQVEEMLHGISPDTHELHRAQDYDPDAFGGVGDDVLVAVDNRTGGLSLLSVLSVMDNKINFDSESGARTSIYGNYATDKALREAGFSKEMIEPATIHQFVKMKLALAALAYKAKNRGTRGGVDTIKVGSISNFAENAISFTTMDIELDKLRNLAKYAGDDFDPSVKELLDTVKPISADAYLEKFMAELQNFTDPLTLKYGKDARADALRDKIVGNELNKFDIYSDSFKDLLSSYRRGVFNSLKGPEETRYSDPRFQLVNKAYLDVMGFDLSSRQLLEDRFGKSFVRSAKNSSDYYAQKTNLFYEKEMTRLRDKFTNFNDQHQRLLKNLIKESNLSFNASGVQSTFEQLYRDSGNPEDLMRLKSVDDPTLKPAQKAYIEFFNKHTKEGLMNSLSGAARKGVEDGSAWTEGLVPITMREAKLTDKKSYSSVKLFLRALTPKTKTPFDPQFSDKFDYSFGISDQSSDSGVQHSDVRRRKLNIGQVDEDGNPLSPDPDINKNLAEILTKTVMGGLKQEHLGRVVDTYSAVDGFLSELDPVVKTKESREFLFKWAEQVLHNRVKEERYAHESDIAKKTASTLLFAGNVKQFGVEMFTGILNSTGAAVSNQVQRFLTKGKDGRFNMKDWGWAVAKTSTLSPFKSDLYTHVIMENGMFHADPENLQSNDFTKFDKASLFASKAMYGINHYFFNNSITSTFLAEMKSKGVFEAYENIGTEKEPKWVYRETKDPRFFVYDAERGIGVPPSNAEEQRKLALYQATRKDAAKDGILNEDGSLQYPLTTRQRSEIKQYATRLYGSFNKDTVTGGQYTALGRAMGSFKNWFFQKGVNYWNTTHIDDMYGEFVWRDDTEYVDENGDKPGGYYEWRGEQFEGILQSVGRLVSDIAKQGRNTKLSKIQKENLSKLLMDLMYLLIATSFVTPFFNDNEFFTKTETGQNTAKAFSAAIGEANFAATALGMSDNAMPVVSLAVSSIKKGFSGITNAAMGNADGATEDFNRLVNPIGAVKTIKTIRELVTD